MILEENLTGKSQKKSKKNTILLILIVRLNELRISGSIDKSDSVLPRLISCIASLNEMAFSEFDKFNFLEYR